MQVSNFDTVSGRLAADCANSGNFNLNLPPGKTGGLYAGEHKLGVGGDTYSVYDGKFLVSFGTPGVATVTNQFGRTLPAGSQVFLQLDRAGVSGEAIQNPGVDRVRLAQTMLIDIGNPAVALGTGLATSQSVAAGGRMVLIKTQLDVPRNVVVAWTGTAVCTVRGKDEFGQAMAESSPPGVGLAGLKAFASIDSITFSAAVTAAVAGWGSRLGLPIFINKATDVVSVATTTAIETTTQLAGVYAADQTNPTASSGDVRGTFVPQAPIAINGTISYTLQVNAFDLYYRGRTQYSFREAGGDESLVAPPANLDLDLSNPITAALLTVTRAGLAWSDDLAGIWTQFAANTPRITTKGMLVEEPRTNVIRNNSMQGAIAGSPGTLPTLWSMSAAIPTGLTQTISLGTQNGVEYIDINLAGTAGTTAQIILFYDGGAPGYAFADGQIWSGSIFAACLAKTGVLQAFPAAVAIPPNAGPNGPDIINDANFTRRLTPNVTLAAGTTNLRMLLVTNVINAGTVVNFTMRMGWPQLELGPTVTSPIRTTALAAATRAGDIVRLSNVTGLVPDGSPITLFAQASPFGNFAANTAAAVPLGWAKALTFTDVQYMFIGPSTGAMAGANLAAAVSNFNSNVGNATTGRVKMAQAVNTNDGIFASNGNLGPADTALTIAPGPAGFIGFGTSPWAAGGAGYINGYLEWAKLWQSRIPSAQLQRLTRL